MEIEKLRQFYAEYKHNLLLMFNDVCRYKIEPVTNDHILRYHFFLEHDMKKFLSLKNEFEQIEPNHEFIGIFEPLVEEFKQHRKENASEIKKLNVKTNSYNRLNTLVDSLNKHFLLKEKV